MTLVDAHCHLELPDPEAVLARAYAAGVRHLVVVGMWAEGGTFGNALELAQRHPGAVMPAVGVHPHDCGKATEADWSALEALTPRVCAVGETGLDYHYNHSSPGVQREAFRRTIRLATQARRPLVVHVREADQDAVRILDEEGARDAGGQIHCFTGDRAAAKSYLDLGFHISFSGVVTFKTADEIREALKLTPLDRLLIETDSPYLAPVPYRGKQNEPAYLVETAKKVAEVLGAPLETVARATSENALRLFGR